MRPESAVGVSEGGLKSVVRDGFSISLVPMAVMLGFMTTLSSSFPFSSSISTAFGEFSCPDWYLCRRDLLSAAQAGAEPGDIPSPGTQQHPLYPSCTASSPVMTTPRMCLEAPRSLQLTGFSCGHKPRAGCEASKKHPPQGETQQERRHPPEDEHAHGDQGVGQQRADRHEVHQVFQLEQEGHHRCNEDRQHEHSPGLQGD